MRTLGYIGLSFGLLLSMVVFTHAQTLGSLASIEIVLSPEHPQPGQLVTATVSSASENARAATVVWLLNDEIRQQEAGGDTFTFTAGNLGESQTLSVLVKAPSGQVLTETITIAPAEVTLLWEADTYTPPFYKGRSLYSSGSLIRAEAIPNFLNDEGDPYDPSELIYTWSKNGTVLGRASGVASNSLRTEGPKFFGDYILSVEVTTPDGVQTAQSAALIETTEPVIKLYERSPLTGTQYHNGIDAGYDFSGPSQFEVQAEPYFMDIIHPNDEFIKYGWRVSGTEVFPNNESPSILTIKLSPEDSLSASLEIVVDHSLHLLQAGEANFGISFEGASRNSLFGF